MPGNIYDRRMFRMANGGMMPPMTAGPPMQPAMPPQGALPPELAAMMGGGGGGAGGMPPELAAMMGGGGGGQQPITDPSQLPPEVLQAADENLSAATNELLEQELAAASGEEAARSMANVAAAGDITGLLNAVWDDNRTLDEYRSDLAAVVGAEDAAQTPDSVLALVQPTLQLAQLDQGVGALMQEELAEMGADPGGITGLAAKSAVADSMAAETGALVDAVGGMSGGQPPMMMEESVGMMAAGPGGMEDVTETMVTGMRNGGMVYAQPFGYDAGGMVTAGGTVQQSVSDVLGAPVDTVNYALGRLGAPTSDSPIGGSESISNAIDTVKSLVQGFAAQGVPNPVKEGINTAIEAYGIPVDVVNFALGRLGVPTSDSPIGGSKDLRETFGFETFNESP